MKKVAKKRGEREKKGEGWRPRSEEEKRRKDGKGFGSVGG